MSRSRAVDVMIGLVVVAALSSLLAFCLAFLTRPIWLVQAFDVSRNYNEGWNAYHQAAILAGQRLYADLPAMIVANYPPLSFRLVAGLSRLLSLDVVVAGRLVSGVAFGLNAALVGLMAAAATRSLVMGCFAATLYILGILAVMPGWVVTNDPHLLGQFFCLAGLAAYLGTVATPRFPLGRILLCTFFFGLALAVKPSFISVAAGIAMVELARMNLMRLIAFAASGSVILAAIVAQMALHEGGHWREHLFFARTVSPWVAISNLEKLVVMAGSLFLAGGLALMILFDRDREGFWRWTLLLGGTMAMTLYFSFGGGVAENIFAESLALVCILIALGFNELVQILRRVAISGPAILVLLLLPAMSPIAVSAKQFRQELRPDNTAQLIASTRDAIQIIKSVPGPALCEDLLACFRAHKAFAFDSYFVTERIRAGSLKEDAAAALIDSGHFSVIQIGPQFPYRPAAGRELERSRFTRAKLQAIRDRYDLVFAQDGFGVYRRRGD